MPRTKVSKSSKRNREAANREEKIREFENTFEGFQNTIDVKMQEFITSYEQQFRMLLQRTSSSLMQMKICDILEVDLLRFDDWEQKVKLVNAQNAQNSISISNTSALLKSSKIANPNDEGYLTEDSSTGSSIGSNSISSNAAFTQHLSLPQVARLRTPGPLSSARARRPRRSRSACGDYGVPGSAIKPKPSAHKSINAAAGSADHNSRSKMRTPMASRSKAVSCDRTSKFASNEATSPKSPPTFLRFPKPGELVLSKCGSPLVSNMVPDTFAHLNIPLRNGVLSMRPKKLAAFKADILDDMDPETLQQLRTIHANIDKIVSMADKAGL